MSCPHGAFNDPSTCFFCRGRRFIEFKQMQTGNLASVQFPTGEGNSIRTRIDFSGHNDGKTDPHENTEVVNEEGKIIVKDLSTKQLPGFNGYQRKKT